MYKHSTCSLIIEMEGRYIDEECRYQQDKYYEENIYRFLVCLGCEMATMEHSHIPVEANWTPYLQEEYNFRYYPPRLNSDKLIQKTFKSIIPNHKRIYNEIIESFNAGLNILCSIGVRALLEGICITQNTVTEYTLSGKLKVLKDEKHLPNNIIDGLQKLRVIGNDAAHQLTTPTKEELRLSIEILEDILNRLYETEYRIRSNLDKLNLK